MLARPCRISSGETDLVYAVAVVQVEVVFVPNPSQAASEGAESHDPGTHITQG